MILRWQCQGLRNLLRVLFSDRPIETTFVSLGALLILTYNIESYYVLLVHAGPIAHAQWSRLAFAGYAASAVLGGAIGYSMGRWASNRAKVPWLAVLPWSHAAKKRSARFAALTPSVALSPIVVVLGWVITSTLRQPDPVLSGFMAGGSFVIPAMVAAVIGSSDADQTIEPSDTALAPFRQSLVQKLAAALDGSKPRWLGVWAQADNVPYVSAWWIGSLIVCGGAAGAISIAQWQPWPSVVTGVIGGNLAFIVAINGQPLLSPVLRSTSIGYASVWMALIRLPAALSLAWFLVAALPALLVSRNFGGESAGAVPLLALLDLLFSASLALNPSSRRRAAFFYVILLAVIIYQGLQYGLAYGVLAVFIMLGVVALLWSRARKRFRSRG